MENNIQIHQPRQQGKSFSQSVMRLLNLANMSCGGSKAAAAVLLSAYNIYDYKIDLSDLCLLDPAHFEAAIQIIQLRCQTGIEPHTLIADGEKYFQQLAKDWANLRNDTIH